MHEEKYSISKETADAINKAKKDGRRVIAVGTTSVRALESSCDKSGKIKSCEMAGTRLFIKPAFNFKVINGLLTNFHLPKSTLLLLVSALAGRDRVMNAYMEAIERKYRFYSYGDAMLIL